VKLRVGDVRLFFDVDGAKVVPTDEGVDERPTVVLLHAGPGADHSLYKDTIGPPLTRVAQVVYIDQRGDGRSDRSDASHWTLDTWVEDLRALLDALEIERPVLLGSSVGALVALRFAARYQDVPSRIVLVSAVARLVHARSIAAFERLGGSRAGEVAARYYAEPNDVTFAEYLRVCLPLYTRRGLDAEVVARMEMNPSATEHWDGVESRRVDLRDEVGAIGCPILLLAGEDDPSFALAGVEELAEHLPQRLLDFRRYPNAGHGVFRDAPEAMDEVVAFVRGAS
jgi:proline iminopeptidase